MNTLFNVHTVMMWIDQSQSSAFVHDDEDYRHNDVLSWKVTFNDSLLDLTYPYCNACMSVYITNL